MYFMRPPTELLLLLVGILATIEVRREGWLDRVVSYKKNRFFKDLKALVPMNIKATIIPKPHGYVDSKDWTYDSVVHLILLLRGSEAAAPVQRVLRRAMRPTRRLMMGMAETFSRFPSLSKLALNEFYYDVPSAEDYQDEEEGEPKPAEDDGVIVVSNPVEAKLPSSQISVELLKDIMVQRALAARKMPSTTKTNIPWTPLNTTGGGDDEKGEAGAEGDSGNSTAAADGAAAGGADGEPADGATVAGGGGDTAAGGDAGTAAGGDGATTAAAEGEPAGEGGEPAGEGGEPAGEGGEPAGEGGEPAAPPER